MKKTLLLIFLIGQASCSLVSKPQMHSALSHYNFSYSITNQRKNHIVQVFDDGNMTYIQFFPGFLKTSEFKVTTEGGNPLSFNCKDNKLCMSPSINDKVYIHLGAISVITKEQEVGVVHAN